MTALRVAPSRDHFLRDGRPHVPLLDTVWNAFAEPTREEWAEYLAHRRGQGFTGLLVSLLPTLHDRSENDGARLPFPQRADGSLDSSTFEPAYFDAARRFAVEAVESGFTLFLVVLWSNYVPESPASGMPPRITLPEARRLALPGIVARYFADLEPVLVISGDDPFDDRTTVEMYRDLLHRCRELMPSLLTTFHAWPDATVPDDLLKDPALDFLTLQSGHTADDGAKAVELATRALGSPVTRPVLNAEPCYEGHGHVRSVGRFTAAEVRRVLWTGLVSGAAAGIGYGAHGVWQWHRTGSRFANAGFSGAPFPWSTALRFPGAHDASLARTIWESEGLYRSRPAQELLDRDNDGARLARTADRAVLYLPAARDVRLRCEPRSVRGWDLELRRPIVPALRRERDRVLIQQPDAAGDLVLLLEGM